MKGESILYLFLTLITLSNVQAFPIAQQHQKEKQHDEANGFSINSPEQRQLSADLSSTTRFSKLMKRLKFDSVMNAANLASTGLMIASSAISLSDYFKLKKAAKDQAAAANDSPTQSIESASAAQQGVNPPPAVHVTQTVYQTAPTSTHI